jgi:Holliday junction DNA helicase RuvB
LREVGRQRIVSGTPFSVDDESLQTTLRPTRLADLIGQSGLVEKLRIGVEAAQSRIEPLEHILLSGPPGLGKTTLAHIISTEMGARIVTTSGPGLARAGDLMGILTNLKRGDVLFIDEVHRLAPAVEEFLYPAMEDYRVDFVVDKGAFAKVIHVPLERFTLVGATTRVGFLSSPFRNRFGLAYHLEFYAPSELAAIVMRSAEILGVSITEEAALTVARRSRGTPRVANRLLRRVRDFASVRSVDPIDEGCALEALALEGIDEAGLDDLDRRLLTTVVDHYDGGPVGVEALAATLNEEKDTLVEVVEPYLLKIGFIKRTRSGRVVGRAAYAHLGLSAPGAAQSQLPL